MTIMPENTRTVRYKDTGVDGIVARNFTRRAFYKREWGAIEKKSRGYFYKPDPLNPRTGTVVARGFDKFFDLDDPLSPELQPPFIVCQKENGFLGLLFEHNDEIHIWTKAGPTLYSERAEELLERTLHGADRWALRRFLQAHNVTVALEVVLPDDDPHMTHYPEDQMYVLAVIENRDEFKVRWDLTVHPALDKFRHASRRHDVRETHLQHLIEDADKSLGEGLVIYDRYGRMAKYKTPFYKRLKAVRGKIESTFRADARKGRYWVETPGGHRALNVPKLYIDALGNLYDNDLEATMVALVNAERPKTEGEEND